VSVNLIHEQDQEIEAEDHVAHSYQDHRQEYSDPVPLDELEVAQDEKELLEQDYPVQ